MEQIVLSEQILEFIKLDPILPLEPKIKKKIRQFRLSEVVEEAGKHRGCRDSREVAGGHARGRTNKQSWTVN